MADRRPFERFLPSLSLVFAPHAATERRKTRLLRQPPGVFPMLVGLALVGGGLTAGAMTAAGATWCAWIGLLPLFAPIRLLSPGRAAVVGAMWGGVIFVLLLDSNHVRRIDLGILNPIVLVLTPGLYAFAASGLTRRVGYSPFILAVGWIGVEFAMRPLGLRYGLIAGTQGNGLLLETIGRFLGYFFVAFLLAFANATLLLIIGTVKLNPPRSRNYSQVPVPAVRAHSETNIPSLDLRILPLQARAPPSRYPACF